MKRVESAINEGRCVLAVGGEALRSHEVQAELNRRATLPIVSLGADAPAPAAAVDAVALAPALEHPGGVIVLVEPNPAVDGRGLGALEKLVKGAAHKPRLVVAARAFNPFGLPMALRLLKMEQEKLRAVDFLSVLPVPVGGPMEAPAAAAAAATPAEAAKDVARGPRPELIGREEELATLKALLVEDGGPIVVTGAPGVGRRWLVEAALADHEGERLPDLSLGRTAGHDTLVARIAIAAKGAGDERLHEALTGSERPAPAALAALVAEVAAGEAMSGKVMLLTDLDRLLDRRDASFRHDGRLELVLRALLTRPLALRLVVTSTEAPVFYREGEAAALRVLPLAGLKGRELHDLFEQYAAAGFPREHFGPIHNRTHGHPVASRAFALAVRADGDVEELLEQPKLLKATAVGDIEPLRRNLKKRISKLPDERRVLLGALATLDEPFGPETLRVLGVRRVTRLALLADGLLEQTPLLGDGRKYYVHALVREHLTGREVRDFAVMETLGDHLLGQARELKAAGKLGESIAAAQGANQLLTGARRVRSRLRLPYPDADAIVDDLRAMVRRRKNPRLDIARQRLYEALKHFPGDTELMLLDAELKIAEKASAQAISEAFDKAAAVAPTPEVFHAIANWHGPKQRGKAGLALQAGVEAFPEDARLRRRLAGLLIAQNKLDEAVEVLEAARDLEPMMPDTYGMLGEVYTRVGPERWDAAVEHLEEALRLSPEHPAHLSRKASLLRRQSHAAETPEARGALLEQAEQLATRALNEAKGDPRIQVLLATLILDRGGDVEQARWLLQQAMKQRPTPEANVQRARVLIRSGHLKDAEGLLDRAIKKAASLFEAFEVKAELEYTRGNVFGALDAIKTARERSPKDAPERATHERRIQELGALIESGAANEMLKAAAVALQAQPGPTGGESDGPRRDPGTTTKLRKKHGADAEGDADLAEDRIAAAREGAEE